METKISQKTSTSLASIAFVVLLLVSCSTRNRLFVKDASEFTLQSGCVSLSSNKNLNIQGTIWFKEDAILHAGKVGLQFIENGTQDTGLLPINPIQMVISPNGEEALLDGYELGTDTLRSQAYRLTNHEYQKIGIRWSWNSPVWTENNSIVGTSWDFENGAITVITTDLETGISQQSAIIDRGMSSQPAAKIARNGILTYLWYSNFEGPRLVVYDTKTNKEIARYKNISNRVGTSFYGDLLNSQGTHILSISNSLSTGHSRQQELFGVEIGEEPVQITNFHSKYPYFLIYNLNFGGQRWSPNSRWVLLHAIPSQTGEINSITDPSYLFLVDLQNNVVQQFCEQITGTNHQIAWSPDSQFFAISIKDKIWVVNPKTLDAYLLIERPGIPLEILGWTIP